MKEASAPPPADVPESEPASSSPGLAGILRGRKENGTTSNPELTPRTQPTTTERRKRIIQASLIVADLMLVAFAFYLAFGAEARPGAAALLCCAIAIAAGAWLTCLAFWMD